MLANQFQNRWKFKKSGLAIINTRYSDGTGLASNLTQIWGGNFLTLLSSACDIIVIGGVLIDLLVRFHSNVSLITFL